MKNQKKQEKDSDRGEKSFINFPRPAALLYSKMMSATSTTRQIDQISQFLSSVLEQGKLLDVGTGPGKLLQTLHSYNPNLELYGLDISENMIKLAKRNLKSIDVDLRLGRIQETDYEDNYFDLITCTGSFYLWNEPEKGLNEIHRILKMNKTAYLFETYADSNEHDYKLNLKANVKKENIFRRFLMPRLLTKQLNMTYTIEEIVKIITNSKFKDSYKIQKVELTNLPIWARVELKKGT